MFANSFGRYEKVDCGLIQIRSDESRRSYENIPIPLVAVDVNASVVGAVAQVQITQVYVNKEKEPIEAIYLFPVDSNGGVTHFQAELEGKVIKGVVKEQKEAKAQYEEAVKKHQTAFLAEQNKPDIFKVKVGFLKPGNQAKIIIGYVTEVKNEGESLRFFLPTTIAPRYVPASDTDEKSKELANMHFSESSPAPLTIKVSVSIQGVIKEIQSPTHEIIISEKSTIPQKPTWSKALVELKGQCHTDMDRDFVLKITSEEKSIPRLYKEMVETSTTLMAHFIPSFQLAEQKVELIFLLDRSGSMRGKSIELAKSALQLFLHSLPADCYLNIVGFGSSYQFLFPQSVKYEDESLAMALEHAQSLQANLSGTWIYEPLKAIFESKEIPGYLRQVFVLTDGEVSNTDQVIGLVQKYCHEARLFALGIGDSASHYLVDGIASAGNGTSAFVTYDESINAKVLQQLKNALQPSLTNISIKWEGIEKQVEPPQEINKEMSLIGYGKPKEGQTRQNDFIQSPEKIPPIFDGSQMVFFGVFKDIIPKAVKITAESPDGPLSLEIPISDDNDVGSTGMLHKLAAIKIIREIEMKINSPGIGVGNIEGLKKMIIELACKHGLASKYTSFVAVDEISDAKERTDNWMMQSRYVASQIAHGWGKIHGPTPHLRNQSIQMKGYISSSPKTSGSNEISESNWTKRSGSKERISISNRPNSIKDAARTRVLCSAPNLDEPLMNSMICYNSMPQKYDNPDTCRVYAGYIKKLPSTGNSLMKISSQQSFDGSFKLTEIMANLLGKSLQDIKDECSKNGWDETVWTTALGLAYLAKELGDLKDEWELIARKAEKWLSDNCKNSEEIKMAAVNFIKN